MRADGPNTPAQTNTSPPHGCPQTDAPSRRTGTPPNRQTHERTNPCLPARAPLTTDRRANTPDRSPPNRRIRPLRTDAPKRTPPPVVRAPLRTGERMNARALAFPHGHPSRRTDGRILPTGRTLLPVRAPLRTSEHRLPLTTADGRIPSPNMRTSPLPNKRTHEHGYIPVFVRSYVRPGLYSGRPCAPTQARISSRSALGVTLHRSTSR